MPISPRRARSYPLAPAGYLRGRVRRRVGYSSATARPAFVPRKSVKRRLTRPRRGRVFLLSPTLRPLQISLARTLFLVDAAVGMSTRSLRPPDQPTYLPFVSKRKSPLPGRNSRARRNRRPARLTINQRFSGIEIGRGLKNPLLRRQKPT